MMNLGILFSESFFLGLASLGKVKQGTSSRISLFLTIINLEMISREFLCAADLTKTRTFCIYKLVEVIMISKNEDLVFVGLQVVVLSLESLNNG